jgi:hypothetical protein
MAHHSQLKVPLVFYSLLIRAYGRLRGRPLQMSYAEGFRALSFPELDIRSVEGQWTPPDRRTSLRRATAVGTSAFPARSGALLAKTRAPWTAASRTLRPRGE